MTSELNKQLLEAIEENVDTDWSYKLEAPKNYYNACANECEKICLNAQLTMLIEMFKQRIDKQIPLRVLSEEIDKLQQQLNSLK